MEKLDLNPQEIGIWAPFTRPTEALEAIITQSGWAIIPRVPIFRLPKGYAHKYVLIDGHTRRQAAINTENTLPCNLYGVREEINTIKDCLPPFGIKDEPIKKHYFKRILALYQIYENLRKQSSNNQM